MTVNQEMTDKSSWIWLTSEQMEFPLRSEFANENHGEARSSKQYNDQRTDQTAFFLAPIITDFIRNTREVHAGNRHKLVSRSRDIERRVCQNSSRVATLGRTP